MRRHRVYRMTMRWVSPVHGKTHEPRVFHGLWVRVARTWKVAGGHWPFGPAQDESKHWANRWLRRTMPGRPVLFVGDLNAMPGRLAPMLRTAKAQSAGHLIDRALFRNCRELDEKVLAKQGSDHHPVLLTFEATA